MHLIWPQHHPCIKQSHISWSSTRHSSETHSGHEVTCKKLFLYQFNTDISSYFCNTSPYLIQRVFHSRLNYCILSWSNTYSTRLSCLHHLQNQAVRLVTYSSCKVPEPPLNSGLNIVSLKHFQLYLGGLAVRSRAHDIVMSSFWTPIL